MKPTISTRRTAPEAAPMFWFYPLVNRKPGQRPGFMVTVWRRRFEVRW